MCGIVGIIGLNKEVSSSKIHDMNKRIEHRGPDAEGFFIEDGIALGHRRLSIIDLSSGANQPLVDHSNRYVIVFNGEIYNYQDVKSELDYNWSSNSDTEVILAAYIKWGKACLEKLNGMFAFAIWDKVEQELFIARDRLGVKPLYYSFVNGVFVFASEIRSILASDILEAKIDENNLSEYLRFLSIETPKTLIKDLFQICPGHYLILKHNGFSIQRYWSLLDKPVPNLSNRQEVLKACKSHFVDAVKSRMVADVKVGAFLSGGIDSSAVVAVMAGLSKDPIDTFSIVFNEKQYDESEYSQFVANKYKTNHQAFLMKPADLIPNLDPFFKSMDNPTVDGINTYMISQLVAKTGIKVVLTGIGGDELFAGYVGFERWKSFQKFSWVFKVPIFKPLLSVFNTVKKSRASLKLSDMFDSSSADLMAFYANSRSVYFKNELNYLLDKPILKNDSWLDLNQTKDFPVLSQYSIAELSHYTLDVLMKDTDQMSMAWALEVREPFFDYKLIEFVLKLDDKNKFKKGSPKHLFVEAMGDLLPPEIVNRTKKGFTFPWNFWLRNELKPYCEEALDSLSKRQLFKPEGIQYLWNSFLNNKQALTWLHIWGLVVLEKWMTENNIKN
jgi:asparagine synthase (glutamine-hydrolysing)